jgi:hypothetical protein
VKQQKRRKSLFRHDRDTAAKLQALREFRLFGTFGYIPPKQKSAVREERR